MAKKSSTTDQNPSRARKSPSRRTARTAPKPERDSASDTQSNQSTQSTKPAVPEPPATKERSSTVTTAADKSSPQNTRNKSRSEAKKPAVSATSQATTRKFQSRSPSKSGAGKSSTSTLVPAASESKPSTPAKSDPASTDAVETVSESPATTAPSEQVSPAIETPKTSTTSATSTTSLDKVVVTPPPQAEQTLPSEKPAAPTKAPPIAATEELVAEQPKQAIENESPSMEEILAAAQPVQEPLDEEPQYIPPPLANKYLNKEALRDRLWLRKDYKPIISYVGRLDFQKGVHLIRHGIFYALEHGAQFVLLGTSPEHKINEEFWHLKRQLNDSPDCHLEIGFNEELSHLIYAGSDMIIMPSLYEPCGLAQMLSLKYGTVPIVRWVGGLADTVFDKDHSHKPLHERNGYVFTEPDAQGLESAMHRAIGCWYSYPDDFCQLIINGMRYDYSWNYPGQHYLNIYEHIRCK